MSHEVESITLAQLYEAARRLHDSLCEPGGTSPDEGNADTRTASAKRLARSVLRPLSDVVGDQTPPPAPAADIVELARAATRLRAADRNPPKLLEAVAALQDLALLEAV